MSTLVIHQPEFFPWLGLLDKARQADTFVFLDNVQFDRSSLQHRAKLFGANGPFWLTIPFIHRFPQSIDQVEIAQAQWGKKAWKSIQTAYGRSPGFARFSEQSRAICEIESQRLVDVTVPSMMCLFDAFGIAPKKMIRASELALQKKGSALILELCQALGATRYISGRSGLQYLDKRAFEEHGIKVVVQNFKMPQYHVGRALSEKEARGLSAIDACFHLGDQVTELWASSASSLEECA